MTASSSESAAEAKALQKMTRHESRLAEDKRRENNRNRYLSKHLAWKAGPKHIGSEGVRITSGSGMEKRAQKRKLARKYRE